MRTFGTKLPSSRAPSRKKHAKRTISSTLIPRDSKRHATSLLSLQSLNDRLNGSTESLSPIEPESGLQRVVISFDWS